MGPRTTSFEIGIEKKIDGQDEIDIDSIKSKLIENIKNGSISRKLVIIELGVVKDIYFNGISSNGTLSTSPTHTKRLLLEMDGKYPQDDSDRGELEKKIIDDIINLLEVDIDPIRIQLESVIEIPEREGRIYVQFMVMNGKVGENITIIKY